ncbi:Phosphoribosyl-AMP cyclohydrolase [Candidatus Filomicrobium marinum]|uniref:Phosphoribosyl-AMP cyclohydrolase n=1 Tax=Candidatus Filomicrobium marinum TaxID=1608628 RepID=A0A0D6JI71_9HYPH|nr:phosphoribosyl-AMP cyclohydrolase [Candidatus Filomicrobium marinum]CFX38392.1 Phosphoribosyl-AMP cyclohydrolase [Candidatus Filomicrobium marinum]CPR21521.1 Phosphoribosyl-AMP cyclohydrolase [Candidatus Filomicrobium marinum]
MSLMGPGEDKSNLEEGLAFQPRFDGAGVIPAIVTDADTGQVLMFAFMNAEALQLSLETGIAHFWSRSRGRLWKKGEDSGNRLQIIEMRTDCDQDVIWMQVRIEGHGAACHTGRRTCFYRRVVFESESDVKLVPSDDTRLFDPETIYSKPEGK